MTQEETQRVWERFSQATPLTHVTMGGSGLGLWIARSKLVPSALLRSVSPPLSFSSS